MKSAVRGPMLTAAALTTAGALALAPITVTPPDLHAVDVSPLRVSTQQVQLTDAWFDLLNNTLISGILMGQLIVGANTVYPLPNPIFVAPILTQLAVVNPLTYAVQLLTGEGADVPSEIIAHINNLAVVAQAIAKDVPGAIINEIQAPFIALQDTVDYIATATNKLVALLEAPAVFLNGVLNSQYGLIGPAGPIALGFIIRNVVAQALFTAPPSVLPFKKASGAALRPKASTITVAPSGTASSARSKPKAPSSAASSKRKPAASAKASTSSAGSGHSKRG